LRLVESFDINMRNFFTIILFLLGIQHLSAQVEQLTPLNFNPALYFSRGGYLPQNPRDIHPSGGMKYLVDSGYTVVTTDTLQLPFIDDFSVDRTPNYLFRKQHITATYQNVIAGCLGTEGFNTVQGAFITFPSWTYTWDFVHQVVDSTPQNPIAFTYFGNATSDCFLSTPQILLYWPAYNRYPDWDSTTGFPIDSVVVGTPDTITYAPLINFAAGDTASGILWFDDYAYINSTYPINPPTIGVATLDGLNQYGLPYDNSSTNTYGTADYLTSLPIDLSTYTLSDSIYLSFFYEGGGNGDYPDINDSLIVEFKDDAGFWNVVWADTGYSYQPWVPDTFAQVLILVTDTSPQALYLGDPNYHTFQFRFRNKASLFGNNNHWHIDFVKLDKNRSSVDTAIHDMAFVYPFPTILKNFTQETAKQFSFPADLSDSINIIIHNLDPQAFTNPPATDFTKSAVENYPNPGTIAGLSVTFNAGPTNTTQVIPSAEYHITPSQDSISIVSTAYVTLNAPAILQPNDTLKHIQNFGSVMAYDDGSAETAYGLTGQDLKKFAYEWDLNKPDTLTGFQVMFAQVEGYVGDLVFNFEAWDSIRLNDFTFIDSPVLTILNQVPFYIDSTNGFATYILDTPILIPSHFYFGWAQTDERRLQIGYDVNSTLGYKHMFVFTEGSWDSTSVSVPGSPMIRLLMDSYWRKSSLSAGAIDLTKEDGNLEVYPNPSSGKLNLRTTFAFNSLQISIMNDVGEVVKYLPYVSGDIDISQLANGIYLLNATDPATGKTYHTKVVKAAF